MKLTIITEYKNVDANWMKWWMDQPKPAMVQSAMNDLMTKGYGEITSQDPTSTVTAHTIWKTDEKEN